MREKFCLDRGWKFYKGNPPMLPVVGHQAIYMASKSERGRGFAEYDYFDQDWESVDLPHDYAIIEDYDKKLEGNHGYLKRGVAWYRRGFYINPEDKDKRITIIFDGIATHCTIWVNGHLMERNFCGYNGIEIDVTDILKPIGEINVIAIKVDADEFEGWWYEGAGIYRHVWMVKSSKVAVANWGTFVKPIKKDNNWEIELETKIVNKDYEQKSIKLKQEIVDDDLKIINTSINEVKLTNKENMLIHSSISIQNPVLWDIENPYMYKVVTTLSFENKEIDKYETPFGFRTLKFDADSGFYLNDRHIKIKGVCGHFDHGGLGTAVPEKVWELRIQKLKNMGCNAFRCGHTPAAPEFLRLCDKYGMLVMDESRWFETSRIGLLQVENMLLRDRNHPCVFIWSVGNEEPLQSTEVGENIALHLKKFVKSYDNTRPVTVALNGGYGDSRVSKACDLVGINYNYRAYDDVHKLLPDHPIFSPEVGATSNTRSVYESKPEEGRYCAYDEVHAPFGSTHRKAWEEVIKRDFVFGMFIWTGFEYRGESTWPKLYAGGGAFDSSGFEKDNYYLMKALWTDEPMVHILPHWNLDKKQGELVKVMTYTNCEEVELVLNGRSLGRRKNDPLYQLEWQVPYEKGNIKAYAYNNDTLMVEDEKITLKNKFKVDIKPINTGNVSHDQSVIVLEVSIRDEEGRLASHLDDEMSFELEGLDLLGSGNGDPADHDNNKLLKRKIFKGLCQIVVKMKDVDSKGKIKINTKKYGSIIKDITVNDKRTYNYLPSKDRSWKILKWWKAPKSETMIDLSKAINTNDVNTWEPVNFSENPFDEKLGYSHYYVSTKMPSFRDQDVVASLLIKGIKGEMVIKIEHNKNYWPLPQPEQFKIIEKQFNENNKDELIKLNEFKRDEAVLIHIVTRNTEDTKTKLDSVEWVIK